MKPIVSAANPLARVSRTRWSALLAATLVTIVHAADPSTPDRSFADLDIEALLNQSITSVSKKQGTLHRSAAAVGVITSDDVARLGISTLPEALRLVPGLAVGRATANRWAISARGFNGQFANKLLVLIDGRTVYTPAFAGVYWDVQDVSMESLDRIETIRGPGATLWGANAVNGVINVTTKSAKETQGMRVSASAGTEDKPGLSARYGGKLAPAVFFRADVNYFDRAGFLDHTGADTPDRWDMFRTGLRIDGQPTADSAFAFIGNYYTGHSGEFRRRASLTAPHFTFFEAFGANRGANILGRWSKDFTATSQLTVQAYYDRFVQQDGPNLSRERRETGDMEVQHRFVPHARHDIVWGVGYRSTVDDLASNFGIVWTPARERNDLLNVFVQDEINLVPERWSGVVGTKMEHNDHTGWEIQPNARLLWTPTLRHTAWAAISHASRTPSRFDRGVRLNVAAFRPSPAGPPFLVSLFGNSEVESEKLMAHEVGYRFKARRDLAIDIAGFYNNYDDLMRFVAGPSRMESTPEPAHLLVRPSTMQNAGTAHTFGSEVSAHWRATNRWKLAASYSWLRMHVPSTPAQEGESPEHQFQMRSYYDLPRNVQLNGSFAYVGALPSLSIPSYVRLDIGVRWQPTPSLELGVWGQNLLDPQHPEFTTNTSRLRTEVPRSIVGKASWSF